MLFNVFINDLKEKMRKKQTRGVIVGKKKIWTITYADDIVLLVKDKEDLKVMMKRFKKYLERKNLVLSAEKSKVMVFQKGEKRAGRRE